MTTTSRRCPIAARSSVCGTLTAASGGNHLGGTSFPGQSAPDGLSPFYLELRHDFGGINLGFGSGQLDLVKPSWDWGC
jgi:hypothetical protein